MDRTDKLKYLREEERHEIAWIGHRLGWFLAAESFLLTAAVMSHSGDYQWWYGTAATLALGLFGVVLALRAHLAIRAAQEVVHAWLLLEQRLCPESEQASKDDWGYWVRLPRPMHRGGDFSKDLLHTVAAKYHLSVPMAVVYVWILVSCLAIVHSASVMPSLLVFTPTEAQLKFVAMALLLLLVFGIGVWCAFRQDGLSVGQGGKELRAHRKLADRATPRPDAKAEQVPAPR